MAATFLVILFLSALILVAYTYVGYPLVIARYAGPAPASEPPAADFAVTVVVAVYNGEALVARRISNLLNQSIGTERLSVVVVDDGSTDGTWERLQAYADHPRITLLRQPQNLGKAQAVNRALAAVNTEIVVLADVRQEFKEDAIELLIRHFTDPGVGAVTGNLVFRGDDVDPQGGYWDLEKSIRENESRYRSTVGVTGAVYAARKALIESVPQDLILDDVLIPMRIVRAGYRVKFEANAIAWDDYSASIPEEYFRKVRTLAGNWQLLAEAPWLLSRRENPIYFEFVSHKVLRLLAPWALALMVLTSWLLRDFSLFNALFLMQASLIGLAGLGFLCYLLRLQVPGLSQLMGFALLNFAAIVATFKWFVGRQRDLWRSH